jgi:hypothetical protein
MLVRKREMLSISALKHGLPFNTAVLKVLELSVSESRHSMSLFSSGPKY